jgi:acyl-coenzyme A synthetase/AMP-(fatty) acid ligase
VSTQSQAATAISTLALRGVALPPRIPSSAVITILHSESKILSLSASDDEVAKLANGLKKLGVKKGDRVCIYMPMILQVSYAITSSGKFFRQ